MTSQPGLQTITIHILPNISRSKGNQTMKLILIEYYKYINRILHSQLIEYKKISIFLQKLCRK